MRKEVRVLQDLLTQLANGPQDRGEEHEEEIQVLPDLTTQQDEGRQDRGEGHEEGGASPSGPTHIAG